MVLSIKESKARRLEGMKRANMELTAIGKIHRGLVNGRPPASELKTPLAAVTAARTLHRELELRMSAEGLKPKPNDWGVSVGYVSPDLSVIGFTQLFSHGAESEIMKILDGQIMLGLVFGMVDREAKDEDGRFVMGARPFLTMKQSDIWLSELFIPVCLEMKDLNIL